METKLYFLLMGKTGQGKSATGNSLLNRKECFETSYDLTSKTKDVDFSCAQFDNYLLLVVDGPGLADTDMNKAEDTEATVKNMDKALAMCYGGIDAFLFVIRFLNRFTKEDKTTLDDLKRIFGPSYLDYVIVIVAGGDMYQSETKVEDTECEKSFHDWCSKQAGEFGQLYKDCKKRFVLFNNKETNEDKKRSQIKKLIQLAQGLSKNGRYTSECFKKAEQEREKLIIESNAPILTLKIQQTVSLLTASIEQLSKQPSDSEREKIRARINDVMIEIKDQDKGHGLLKDLEKLLKSVEENLDDVVKLLSLAKELEDTRKAKTKWTVLGSVCAVAGGVLCLAATPVAAAAAVGTAVVASVGAAIGGGSALLTGVTHLSFRSNEKDIEKQRNDLEKKLQKK